MWNQVSWVLSIILVQIFCVRFFTSAATVSEYLSKSQPQNEVISERWTEKNRQLKDINNHKSHNREGQWRGHPLLEPGRCKHEWRTDPQADLPGKCFAGWPHTNYDDLKNISIRNHKECRSLCCNLGERCNTWQFQNSTGTCKIEKGFVRRGPEGADTVMYCDPYAPVAWNGKMLKERNSDGACTWAWTIPKQCFSFGMERLNTTKGRMGTEECEAACCADKGCNSYQEYPGRGCYYGISQCQHEPVEGAFEGGRKCKPHYCGGWEDKILGSDWYKKDVKAT